MNATGDTHRRRRLVCACGTAGARAHRRRRRAARAATTCERRPPGRSAGGATDRLAEHTGATHHQIRQGVRSSRRTLRRRGRDGHAHFLMWRPGAIVCGRGEARPALRGQPEKCINSEECLCSGGTTSCKKNALIPRNVCAAAAPHLVRKMH